MNVIQTDLSGSYVYKVERSDKYHKAQKQMVKVGNSYNGIAEITEGLNEGDLVVSTGFQEIIEGENVRFGLQAMK
jgi:multidrug efflux pump subunit AcrA (membrane-fusion protein)